MSLTCVKMSEDVWLTCLTHALSTETEEIMGLLLGDIEHSKDGNVTALIWGASPQSRSDRRKDRVETNPEQLAAASAQAERMTASTGRTTRVIGWYHSHPHITVLPSHVDVRTQAMYQLLDSGFIGLIFSCFSEDTNKVGRIQVIAFQSSDGKHNNMLGPVILTPVNRNAVIAIDSSLSSSENTLRHVQEEDTGDSRSTITLSKGGGQTSDLGGFFGKAVADYQGREKSRENYGSNYVENATGDVDPMDMSESMQEAMHRSNLDISGAEFVRKEIPLHVLPTSSIVKIDSPLGSFTDLQRVLFEEEHAAHGQAILQNMRDGKVHPLAFIHHTSTYQASLCKLIEYCLSPAIDVLQDRLKENEIRLAMLTDEARILETEAFKGSEPSSPHHGSPYGLRGSPSGSQGDLHNSAEPSSLKTFSRSSSRNRKRS